MKYRLVNVFIQDQLLHICKIETGDVHVSETCYIESFTEVKEFLHSIRKVGATNSNEWIILSKSLTLSCDATHIRKRLHGNEGIMATYHALFIHITKREEMK